MSEDVKESERPDKIVDIVKKVLEFDKKNQEGQLLKLISTGQLLGRLPITVAHLKTWNNSGKLENEIRQLLYSLYRSKRLTKKPEKSIII